MIHFFFKGIPLCSAIHIERANISVMLWGHQHRKNYSPCFYSNHWAKDIGLEHFSLRKTLDQNIVRYEWSLKEIRVELPAHFWPGQFTWIWRELSKPFNHLTLLINWLASEWFIPILIFILEFFAMIIPDSKYLQERIYFVWIIWREFEETKFMLYLLIALQRPSSLFEMCDLLLWMEYISYIVWILPLNNSF